MLIELGKTYRTRGGDKVHIFKTDLRDAQYPIVGYRELQDGDEYESWTAEGKYNRKALNTCLDIVALWQEPGVPTLSPKLIKALPEWANWVAMDEDGMWCWFGMEPYARADLGMWHRTTLYGIIPDSLAPDWTGDWRDSLVEVVR